MNVAKQALKANDVIDIRARPSGAALLVEKHKYSQNPTKNQFITSLDNEIKKKPKTPDMYFKEFMGGKITIDELEKKFEELGTGKYYYYYKVLSDKLKEMP